MRVKGVERKAMSSLGVKHKITSAQHKVERKFIEALAKPRIERQKGEEVQKSNGEEESEPV